MITMITGGPGLGKTALAVSMLVEQYADRPIFTNIRGLTLDHSELPKLEEWTIEQKNGQGTSEHVFTFPPGAVVVIDECQQFFRPRATGSKVPPYVSAFETHRHRGIDFILITQGSRLVDSNIRSLLKGGLHIFLRTSYVGRYRYEKSECINEDERSSYQMAARRRYKLPKHAFPLYKSSELHTKPPRAKLPMAVYIIVAAVVVGGGLAWKTTDKLKTTLAKEQQPMGSPTAVGGATAQPAAQASQRDALASMSLTEALTPVDDHDPLSAPLYVSVRPVVTAPEIVGCVATEAACSCYSQQVTPVWVPLDQCRARAAGRYYDPYRNPSSKSQTESAYAPRLGSEATAPPALSGGFEPRPAGA
jgi:zona occludens toxin